jgi:hypothetical protein
MRGWIRRLGNGGAGSLLVYHGHPGHLYESLLLAGITEAGTSGSRQVIGRFRSASPCGPSPWAVSGGDSSPFHWQQTWNGARCSDPFFEISPLGKARFAMEEAVFLLSISSLPGAMERVYGEA